MKVRNISLETIMKERLRAKKLAQKAKIEQKTAELYKRTAKSILHGRFNYTLNVNNPEAANSKLMFYSADSVWAPWSKLSR